MEHASSLHVLFPPGVLLGRNVLGADDLDMWVNQKQSQQFSVPWSGGICKLERGHFVLHDIRKAEETGFSCKHFA